MSEERQNERQAMVEQQLRARGIHDERVLAAMAAVPRHRFVPDNQAQAAYKDAALPIEAGQTISQPFIVALTAEALALQPGDRVLEIGTGSGYAAAVLSRLAAAVYSVERNLELARAAERRLQALGYSNVHTLVGDGTRGWREHAPYQAIAIAAAAPQLPQPLLDQLADGGRLVLPLGDREEQWLIRVVRQGSRLNTERICPVRFVPLIGMFGWSAEPDGRVTS